MPNILSLLQRRLFLVLQIYQQVKMNNDVGFSTLTTPGQLLGEGYYADASFYYFYLNIQLGCVSTWEFLYCMPEWPDLHCPSGD